jgi:WD40 repeat protein
VHTYKRTHIHTQLLIAYEHNYLELWDALTWKPKAIFGPFKEDDLGDLLTCCWHTTGTQFLTTHHSGAISLWSLDNQAKPINVTRFHGKRGLLCVCTCMK